MTAFDPKRTLANLGRSRSFGGEKIRWLKKNARFLNVGTESVMNYARTGSMPPDVAKKLGKATKINWRFLLNPV
jgi:hypothetical protein